MFGATHILIASDVPEVAAEFLHSFDDGRYRLTVVSNPDTVVEAAWTGFRALVLAHTASLAIVREVRRREEEAERSPIPLLVYTNDPDCDEAGASACFPGHLTAQGLLAALLVWVPTSGNNELDPDIRALLPLFFDRCREDIERLRASWELRDYETLGRIGHNLKGTGATFGFPHVGALGAEIEQAAKNRRDCGAAVLSLSSWLAQIS